MGTTKDDSQDVGREVKEISRQERAANVRLYISLAIFAVIALVVGFAIVMNMRFPVR